MKNLNLLNRIYIFILAVMVIAIVIKVLNYDEGERYYYAASFTAPPTYRMYVQDGYFITEDDETDIKSNEVNEGCRNWGDRDMAQVDTKERLPKALVLRYASYREKAFYFDTILMPAKLIGEIFASSFKKDLNVKIGATSVPELPGMLFLIGIANNGNIVIWLQGKRYERKLLTYHLKPVKPTQDQVYENNSYPPKTYFDNFNFDTTGYKAMIAKGIDGHANYADSASHYIDYYGKYNFW